MNDASESERLAQRRQGKFRNSKSEIRNKSKMIKKHEILNKLVSDFDFWILDLSVSVCFGFRASDFGFLFGSVLAG